MAALADFLIADPPAPGLQRLRAGLSGYAYDRHRHETYAVGVTEQGLQCFHYRGAARASTTGRVIVIYPDEVHDGHAGAPSGFVYSMLYVDPSLIAAALGGRACLSVASRSLTTLRCAAGLPCHAVHTGRGVTLMAGLTWCKSEVNRSFFLCLAACRKRSSACDTLCYCPR
jgi:AraC-like protein